MGVAFYILFLLVASPLKKEDACKTNEKQAPPQPEVTTDLDDGGEINPTNKLPIDVSIGNNKLIARVTGQKLPAPEISIDQNVKDVYDYGDTITLKWNVAQTTLRVKQCTITVFTGPTRSIAHKGEIQCEDTSNDCSRYEIPESLEPFYYEFVINAYFLEHVQPTEAKGSFIIKNPLLDIVRPVHNHEYKFGEDIDFEWSLAKQHAGVEKLKIEVFEVSMTLAVHGDEVKCVDNKNDCSSYQLRKTLDPGRYHFVIRVHFSGDDKIEVAAGSFAIKAPPPQINLVRPVNNNHRYQNYEKVVVEWSTARPNENLPVVKYTALVWNVLPWFIVHQKEETCHSKHCSECHLPKLETGEYAFVIEVYYAESDKHAQASGSFSIWNPSLRAQTPVNNRLYEHGEQVVLEWTSHYHGGNVEVIGSEITVWDISLYNPSLYDDPCRIHKSLHHCRMGRVLPGKYKWMVEATTSKDGERVKDRDFGTFMVVRIPVPDINPPLSETYEYGDEITIDWTIDDPKQRIKEHKVLVWGVGVNVSAGDGQPATQEWILFDVKCRDNRKCTEFVLPTQDPGSYKCWVKVESRKGNIRTSPMFREVVVKKKPGLNLPLEFNNEENNMRMA